ncbi:MAG: glycoside hydrolase family 140 protein [Phycisphaerales bacterium]|nr:MAG: glycoside hydrolase family 140 protein [Phycisphaerales bacterium]
MANVIGARFLGKPAMICAPRRGRYVWILLLLCSCGLAAGDSESGRPVDFSHGPLKVSANKRFLVHADGTPFFYLGDTAWELFHRLNRADVDKYLESRRQNGFTVIQAVALAELDGLNTPNPYGHRPLIDNDPARPDVKDGPDNDYWDHVDYIVGKAESLGLYIGMLPTWGDKWNKKWGKGPVVFNPKNAEEYGRWLGRRYKDRHIIWILGGDRPIEDDTHKAIIRAMARGIKAGDGGRHLMTFHPTGGRTSSEWFHDDDWLDFNMHQTGHRDRGSWQSIEADYKRSPTKPVLDGEPLYEDHPINFDAMKFGFSVDWQIRRLAYWHVFAGSCGHTYGCHNIWQMYAPGRAPISVAHHYWYESLDLWGAGDMQHVKNLMLSRPYLTRIPDQSIVVSDVGDGDDHVQATRDSAGVYALVYSPLGQPVTVNLQELSGLEVTAWWYDPRHGTAAEIGTFAKEGNREFKPPIAGKGNDWVLVLDDASQRFGPPGSPRDGRVSWMAGNDRSCTKPRLHEG